MATKKELLEDQNSCLNKAGDDEPLFVLRAHDLLSPDIVRSWANRLTQVKISRREPIPEKVADAMEVANAMSAWPDRKYPD